MDEQNCEYALRKKTNKQTIHQVTTMLATPKNALPLVQKS